MLCFIEGPFFCGNSQSICQGIREHLHFTFDSGPGFCEVGNWELFISNPGENNLIWDKGSKVFFL